MRMGKEQSREGEGGTTGVRMLGYRTEKEKEVNNTQLRNKFHPLPAEQHRCLEFIDETKVVFISFGKKPKRYCGCFVAQQRRNRKK